MSTIKIKRGARKNLPTLISGELAFTTDSNELFAGSLSGENINLTPYKNNLLANGNFQRALLTSEGTLITSAPSSSIYAFGNYFFTNPSDSTGSYIFYRNTNQNGHIIFNATNSKPLIDYKMKYSRTVSNDTSYSYQDILGAKFTLSFDYTNPSSQAIDFECGCINNMVAGKLTPASSGRFFASFSYAAVVPSPLGFPFFYVTLFKASTLFNGTFSLGNFKLEYGTAMTPFYPNPFPLDNLLLSDQYFERTFSLRPSMVTLNTLQLNIGNITTATVYNPKVSLSRSKVYNLLGVVQSGFIPTISFNTSTNLAEAVFTKTAHALTDGYITGLLTVDNRP